MFGVSGLRQLTSCQLKLWAARIALKRPSPDSIPLDHHRAQSRNYTTAYFSTSEDRHAFLVAQVEGRTLRGRVADPNGGLRQPSCITAADLDRYGTFFVRYYRELEIRYTSPLRFLIQEYLGAHWWLWQRERRAQARFNRRTLTRLDRIRVLEMFVEADLEAGLWGIQLGADGLVERIERHEGRFWRHPDAERHHRYYQLVLESLGQSGELTPVDGTQQYRLSAQAFATLSTHAAEDRRHRDMKRLQEVTASLTIVIALATALQAIAALSQFSN